MKEANSLIKTLKGRGLTLALTESVTCGMAAHRLSNSKGVSEVLKGALICYTPEVKADLLGVSQKLIDQYTCESAQVTEALVRHMPELIKADIYAAITGLASPGGSETKDKPVGSIFYALKFNNQLYREQKLFKGTPLQIKTQACTGLYQFILSKLNLH